MELLYDEIIQLKKINCDFLASVNQLKEENKKLKEKVYNLESRLNWREQKIVENAIEIIGVPGVNTNNAIECVQTIFDSALNLTISSDDIQQCYIKRSSASSASVSSSDPEENKNNVIRVHFSTQDMKKKVMKNKRSAVKKLNSSLFVVGSNSSIYINECFTGYTRALYMQAKKIKTERNYKYLWFQNCQILMRKVDKGRVIAVRSFADLESLVD